MNQGSLVPCGLTEVLPGDSIQQSSSALVRLSPLLAPMMHRVDVRIHHWFVPHRLVWEDWEKFITGGPDGMDASVFPTISTGGGAVAEGDLMDYLGVPTGVASQPVSALPIRGYQLIWREWYRDQDLETAPVISLASGADVTTDTVLKNVAWEKDYFTTARPWTQKGPEVTLPLGTTAPVVTDGTQIRVNAEAIDRGLYGVTGGNLVGTDGAVFGAGPPPMAFGTNTGLETDLTGATSVDVNSVRLAFALQRYEEARARYGSRYTEYLRYMGVRSSDARLQRPEYLGGGKQTLQVSEVLQTAEGTDAVGTMRGHGIGMARGNRYRRFFEEHGYIFTLISVKPKTVYVQGLFRTWNRRSKEDFFQKELQFIGQQEVLQKELFFASATPDAVFGYQDRYDEYRRSESSVAGQFRSVLDFWHMARIFAATPALNAAFVSANPTDRVYADPGDDVCWVMVNHSIQARRLVAASGGGSHIF